MIAVASISIRYSGAISPFTSTIVVQGFMSLKNSPCALPYSSQRAISVTYILVRTTSFNEEPALFKTR